MERLNDRHASRTKSVENRRGQLVRDVVEVRDVGLMVALRKDAAAVETARLAEVLDAGYFPVSRSRVARPR